jgi:hypothetical protein
MTGIEITYLDDDVLHPLYLRYPDSIVPQDAYIEIDYADRTICAGVDHEIGNGVPQAVWSGRVGRYVISHHLTADEINALLDDVSDLAVALCDSHKDGGIDDDRLEEKMIAGCDVCRNGPETYSGGVIDASDWYADVGADPLQDIQDAAGDISAAAERVRAVGESDQCTVVGVEGYLKDAASASFWAISATIDDTSIFQGVREFRGAGDQQWRCIYYAGNWECSVLDNNRGGYLHVRSIIGGAEMSPAQMLTALDRVPA